MVPFFFKTKDEIIWFTISMFEDKYLAFPKYYFDNGKKIKGTSYSQWYIDIPEQLKKYYTYSSGVGENVFLVRQEDILEYYNPILRAKRIYKGIAENNEHTNKIRALITKLQNFFNIPLEDIGIDGSSLLGDYKNNSDIDILIYGKKNGDILKNKFKSFDEELGIKLFSKKDLDNNTDIPKTIYTTGFGQEKEQSFEQFLRRYYGYIGEKRFSLVCVPKENEEGYININRNLKRKEFFSGEVIILEDKYSGIVPTIYKIIDKNNRIYTLEIFNHYGINQAKTGERFYLSGQIYENEANKDNSIIMSFWNINEQIFSIIKRDKKQEVIDKLKAIMIQLEETNNESSKLAIKRVLDEITTKYTEISKQEVIKHIYNYMKNENVKSTEQIYFTINPIDILTHISNNKQKLSDIKETECGLNFYCLEIPNCGKLYENNYQKKVFNHITIITFAENNEIISFLPTEKININIKRREQDIDERV